MISKLFRISVVTSIVFLLFANLASAAVLDVTNTQKLSLDPNTTTVGKKVRVSDGFLVSGSSDTPTNTFYFANGGTQNGKPTYSFPINNSGYSDVYYDGTEWVASDGNTAALGNEDYPWQANWTGVGLALTHPVIQKLVAPSTDLNAVYISGAGTADANGIYTKRGIYNSKPYYLKLGQIEDDSGPEVAWVTAGTWDPESQCGNSCYGGGSWQILSGGLGTDVTYAAHDDVAYPWLATFTEAPQNVDQTPTASSVTQGEIDAGVTVSGGGTTSLNGTYTKAGVNQARNSYGKIGTGWTQDTDGLQYANGEWDIWKNGDAPYITSSSSAFPFNLTFDIAGGSAPAPTVTRNNIAAEANWALFTPVATSIQFGTQPSNTNVDTAISPAVTVQILDQDGDLIDTATNNVTISIGTNPGGGTLSGTATVAAVNGVATFSNLKIDKGGTGYTLSAAVSGAGTATSDTFNIIAPTVTTTVHTGGGRMAPPPSNIIPNTQNNSNNSNIPPPATPPKCIITNTLALGWVGPQVKCLQTILNIKVDGIFGQKTKLAVIAFQKTNGLKVDGIVGVLTRNKLNALL